jgi:hypothetical protein
VPFAGARAFHLACWRQRRIAQTVNMCNRRSQQSAETRVPIRVQSAPMSDFVLETGEHIIRVTCGCCGNEKKRVWGFVSKAGDAHAVYYALLNVTEDSPRVGLTLSIGPWWGDTDPSQRSWCHIDIRAESDKFQFVVRDPKESNFYPWERGGTPLSPEQAAANGMTDEIQSVSKFIVETDRAISSYLSEIEVNTVGRAPRESDRPQHSC